MRKRRGFTLIKLLVVIAIIALLIAILLPSLQQIEKQAKAVVCQSNLHQWGMAFFMYADDNDGRIFDDNIWPNPNWWPVTLRSYGADSDDLLLCPMATKVADTKTWTGGTFSAWRWSPEHGSYGMNYWIPQPEDEVADSEIYPYPWFWVTSDVDGRHNIPVLLDSCYPKSCPHDTDEPPQHDAIPKPSYPSGGMPRFCINRHNGHINSLFMDWSVRKVGLKELWTLKWHREFNTRNRWTRAGGVKPEDWPQWMRRFKDY